MWKEFQYFDTSEGINARITQYRLQQQLAILIPCVSPITQLALGKIRTTGRDLELTYGTTIITDVENDQTIYI